METDGATVRLGRHQRPMTSVAEREERIAALAGRARCRGPLPAIDIARGGHMCWSNATSLLDDVRLLMSQSRMARALSLTVLALEELAKPPLLWSTTPGHDQKPWDRFWRQHFSRHSEKQEAIARYGILTGLTSEIYRFRMCPATVQALDTLKQWGFYVDCVDGSFQSPSEFAADLGDVIDLLFAVAEERADSFAGMHASPEQSLWMHEHRFDGQTFGELWPPPVRSGIDLHGVLLSTASKYSLSDPPNYAAFADACGELLKVAGRDQFELALTALGRACSERAQLQVLPTAAARALFMMKMCLSMVPEERRAEAIEEWK